MAKNTNTSGKKSTSKKAKGPISRKEANKLYIEMCDWTFAGLKHKTTSRGVDVTGEIDYDGSKVGTFSQRAGGAIVVTIRDKSASRLWAEEVEEFNRKNPEAFAEALLKYAEDQLLEALEESTPDTRVMASTARKDKTPAKNQERAEKAAPAEKASGKNVDRFGSKLGTNAAKVNAVLSKKPMSFTEICKAAKLNGKQVRYLHLHSLVAAGFATYENHKFALTGKVAK